MMNETQVGDTGRAEQFWDEHYDKRDRDRVWSETNAVLIDVVASLPAGSALDLGCGEGGGAIWLAQRGWRVTAVDVSGIALRRAAAHAAAVGVQDRIDFQKHDLAFSFPIGAFDLVSAQFLHSPLDFPRHRVLQAAARAVASGGILLIVEHASSSPWSWSKDTNKRFPTPEETLAAIELDPGQWRAERLGSPQRQATGPNGETALVTDNVIAMRRLS